MTVRTNFGSPVTFDYYGVFDGHGGSESSSFCSLKLHDLVRNKLSCVLSSLDGLLDRNGSPDGKKKVKEKRKEKERKSDDLRAKKKREIGYMGRVGMATHKKDKDGKSYRNDIRIYRKSDIDPDGPLRVRADRFE